MTKRKIKVCYVLSYRSPDYIRTRTLLAALSAIEDVDLHLAVNSHKGLIRYVETLIKLLWERIKHHPDVYILGFRGQEVFLPVRLLTTGKPLIFDEFVNLYEWVVEERQLVVRTATIARLVKWYNGLCIKMADLILTDTKTHADYSAKLHNIRRNKFETIYVGTDEANFKKRDSKQIINKNEFSVFFYGNMHPLHGIEIILETAKKLKDQNIIFHIVGGKGKTQGAIKNYISHNNLNNITYKSWVPYEKLPSLIAKVNLCLAGPFGNTIQAQHVITGKAFQFLAMGKPAILGITDERTGLIDKENVLFVKQGDPNSLSKVILWAYNNPIKIEQIGKKGHKFYTNELSLGVQSVKLLKILRNIYNHKTT